MHATTRMFLILCACLLQVASAQAAARYSFGVLSQRSAVLTAEYWNPILAYVSGKTGIDLVLKLVRTAPQSNAAIRQGAYDFAYSNHLFRPSNQAQHYRVILRPRSEAIRGQVVTVGEFGLQRLAQLDGRVVGFPSRVAFVGYALPMDHLIRSGIQVKPVFGGNQEGIMGQLLAGKVDAAGVNSQVMRDYARRKDIQYRVLWQSMPYYNLPIAVHPRVPKAVADAVQHAFAGMHDDPAGRRILQASARVIDQRRPLGFVASNEAEYQDYLDFYQHTVVQGID